MVENDCISVIVPVYKVEDYLSKCVQSIIEQTYENLDIILVDDGSPDNCGDICDEYAQKDSRIRVVHKENGGLSDARNAGIEIAKGKYYTFVDSDDWLEVDFCEFCLNKMTNQDADIVSVSLKNIGENEKVLSASASEIEWIYTPEEALVAMFNPKLIRWCAQAKLYKANLFDGVRYPVGRTMEDKATTYKLFSKAKKIIFSDTYKYNYLIRQGSIMRTSFGDKDKDSYGIQRDLNAFLSVNYPNVVPYSYAHTVRAAIILLSKMVAADEIDVVFGEQLFKDIKRYGKYFFKGKVIDWRYKPVGWIYGVLHGIHHDSVYSKSKVFAKICLMVVRKLS